MSVLDRMRRQQAEQETTDTEAIPSSSLALVDPPVIQRVKQLVSYAVEYAKTEGSGIPWYVETLISEVMEEMSGIDPEQAGAYLIFTAGLMKWAATGEYEDLPDVLKTEAFSATIPALPSGEDVSAYQ